MLEGKLVNLRVMEEEDLRLFAEWANNPEFGGEYEPLEQISFKEWRSGIIVLVLEKNGSS